VPNGPWCLRPAPVSPLMVDGYARIILGG